MASDLLKCSLTASVNKNVAFQGPSSFPKPNSVAGCRGPAVLCPSTGSLYNLQLDKFNYAWDWVGGSVCKSQPHKHEGLSVDASTQKGQVCTCVPDTKQVKMRGSLEHIGWPVSQSRELQVQEEGAQKRRRRTIEEDTQCRPLGSIHMYVHTHVHKSACFPHTQFENHLTSLRVL